jgi:hypothetical protein
MLRRGALPAILQCTHQSAFIIFCQPLMHPHMTSNAKSL